MSEKVLCLHCLKNNDEVIICDNDCGTFCCSHCGKECYSDENKKIHKGHSPTCGNDTDELDELDEYILRIL